MITLYLSRPLQCALFVSKCCTKMISFHLNEIKIKLRIHSVADCSAFLLFKYLLSFRVTSSSPLRATRNRNLNSITVRVLERRLISSNFGKSLKLIEMAPFAEEQNLDINFCPFRIDAGIRWCMASELQERSNLIS